MDIFIKPDGSTYYDPEADELFLNYAAFEPGDPHWVHPFNGLHDVRNVFFPCGRPPTHIYEATAILCCANIRVWSSCRH